jgi:hypothetical protein
VCVGVATTLRSLKPERERDAAWAVSPSNERVAQLPVRAEGDKAAGIGSEHRRRCVGRRAIAPDLTFPPPKKQVAIASKSRETHTKPFWPSPRPTPFAVGPPATNPRDWPFAFRSRAAVDRKKDVAHLAGSRRPCRLIYWARSAHSRGTAIGFPRRVREAGESGVNNPRGWAASGATRCSVREVGPPVKAARTRVGGACV